jgi:hypothetical protein
VLWHQAPNPPSKIPRATAQLSVWWWLVSQGERKGAESGREGQHHLVDFNVVPQAVDFEPLVVVYVDVSAKANLGCQRLSATDLGL